MPNEKVCLVTGGSGYLGTALVKQLVLQGWKIKVLDLNVPEIPHAGVEYIQGDVRDLQTCINASKQATVVFHAIAQVPLAKNKLLTWETNVLGTENICKAIEVCEVKTLVYISSSAVYGIPEELPVTLATNKIPVEHYGHTKLLGEEIATTLYRSKINVSIVRPRTILGSARLGIFGILFRWISLGINIPILGSGAGSYQYVHVEDLVQGIIKASFATGFNQYNLGCVKYKSFKEEIQDLCDYSKSGSRVFSLSSVVYRPIVSTVSKLGFLPFAVYQLKMFSRPMYFDSEASWLALDYYPRWTNIECLFDSYNSFTNLSNVKTENLSHHQTLINHRGLDFVTNLLSIFTSCQNMLFSFLKRL
jgi:nucleoside-diphosphate-sugar epimerase